MLFADTTATTTIPLPNIGSEECSLILEWCAAHTWQRNDEPVFLNASEQQLMKLVTAATYLDIPQLLDILCHVVAKMIRNKNVEEIRAIFGIVNDFTPEQEAEVRQQHAWAFS